jgi:hypothetical protein
VELATKHRVSQQHTLGEGQAVEKQAVNEEQMGVSKHVLVQSKYAPSSPMQLEIQEHDSAEDQVV